MVVLKIGVVDKLATLEFMLKQEFYLTRYNISNGLSAFYSQASTPFYTPTSSSSIKVGAPQPFRLEGDINEF